MRKLPPTTRVKVSLVAITVCCAIWRASFEKNFIQTAIKSSSCDDFASNCSLINFGYDVSKCLETIDTKENPLLKIKSIDKNKETHCDQPPHASQRFNVSQSG